MKAESRAFALRVPKLSCLGVNPALSPGGVPVTAPRLG